ncbi:MAG: hypothetical protein LBJ73_00060 [Rickettsiales bacterium]|jgi:hypothetical protein|nr:hypothetical protein [Rickettsiales bacterium]
MATILERNKNLKPNKKTTEEYAEDALYREVWEDVNNEKTQRFLKKYSRYLIAGALAVMIAVTAIQMLRHHNQASRVAAATAYETAIDGVDAGALASLGRNSSGATADLALFQSWMLTEDTATLEKLARDGHTRDFRDLAKLHLAAVNGDAMDAKAFENSLSDLNTRSSPYYYSAMLLIAQKYLASGDRATADVWLDKIINDQAAPLIVAANAQTLR